MKVLTQDELKSWALDLIEIVDYDVRKECELEIKGEGFSDTVEEMIVQLELLMIELDND